MEAKVSSGKKVAFYFLSSNDERLLFIDYLLKIYSTDGDCLVLKLIYVVLASGFIYSTDGNCLVLKY